MSKQQKKNRTTPRVVMTGKDRKKDQDFNRKQNEDGKEHDDGPMNSKQLSSQYISSPIQQTDNHQ